MRYIFLAIVLPVMILGWSGILRTSDLAFYDLGFRLRPEEPTDERIVLVEWKEENIQTQEETNISDDTFVSLIEKIKAQQPRFIALDIYRDIPVSSPNLNDQENEQAYERLQDLFRSTSNLIGIEKVLPRRINASKVLKEKLQVGATDLPPDRDSFIRRAYTFPTTTEDGKPIGIPYLSVGLASGYLEKEGWGTPPIENKSLLITNQQDSISINPLKAFAGAYDDDKNELDFLINWRKGKQVFKRISSGEITSGQVAPDLFYDRLVIIGNVSSSAGDLHRLPLNRWRRTNKIGTHGVETYGVEIVAQVASSIISAALDGRPLMNSTPQFLNLILYLFSVGIVIRYINKHRYDDKNLYSSAIVPTLSITVIAILSCFILHRFGIWFPIAWLLASTWIAYLAFTYYLEWEKEQNKITALEGFNENLLHNLRNSSESISQNQNAIQAYAREIQYDLMNYDELANEEGVKIIEQLETIYDTAVETEDQNNRIRRYRITSEQFLRYCFLNIRDAERLFNANHIVKDIVGNFVAENEDKISRRLSIIEKYDPRIDRLTQENSRSGLYTSSAALEIVLENLLCNATFAINAKEKIAVEEYFPKLSIQTKLIKNKIELIIQDNGVGIPKAYQKKIFLPFKSYRSEQTGQGIGLYLSKKIADFHRGSLKVQSIEGKGTKFILALPVVVQRNHTRLFNNLLSFLRNK